MGIFLWLKKMVKVPANLLAAFGGSVQEGFLMLKKGILEIFEVFAHVFYYSLIIFTFFGWTMLLFSYFEPSKTISMAAHQPLSTSKVNLHQLIIDASQKYGIDPALIASVIHFESNSDPCSQSSAGAMGLMQVIRKTSISMIGNQDIYIPYHNVDAGTKLLAINIKTYGLVRGLAMYNYGSRSLRRSIGRWPPETQRYVYRVATYASHLTWLGKQSWKQAIPEWIDKSSRQMCRKNHLFVAYGK